MRFLVKLQQQEWLTTEVFDTASEPQVFPTEPQSAEEAQAMAEAFVKEHKDLAKANIRFDVEEVVPEPTEADAAVEEQGSELRS